MIPGPVVTNLDPITVQMACTTGTYSDVWLDLPMNGLVWHATLGIDAVLATAPVQGMVDIVSPNTTVTTNTVAALAGFPDAGTATMPRIVLIPWQSIPHLNPAFLTNPRPYTSQGQKANLHVVVRNDTGATVNLRFTALVEVR